MDQNQNIKNENAEVLRLIDDIENASKQLNYDGVKALFMDTCFNWTIKECNSLGEYHCAENADQSSCYTCDYAYHLNGFCSWEYPELEYDDLRKNFFKLSEDLQLKILNFSINRLKAYLSKGVSNLKSENIEHIRIVDKNDAYFDRVRKRFPLNQKESVQENSRQQDTHESQPEHTVSPTCSLGAPCTSIDPKTIFDSLEKLKNTSTDVFHKLAIEAAQQYIVKLEDELTTIRRDLDAVNECIETTAVECPKCHGYNRMAHSEHLHNAIDHGFMLCSYCQVIYDIPADPIHGCDFCENCDH